MSGQIGPCAKVAAHDAALFDRMWSTVSGPDGKEVIDKPMRDRGRAICCTCPLRTACLADALVGGWKDRNIIGGLTYPERCRLATVSAAGLGLEDARRLHDLPAWRVKSWLDSHKEWQQVGDDLKAYWRDRRRSSRRRRKYPAVPPDFRPVRPMPDGTAFQPELLFN